MSQGMKKLGQSATLELLGILGIDVYIIESENYDDILVEKFNVAGNIN